MRFTNDGDGDSIEVALKSARSASAGLKNLFKAVVKEVQCVPVVLKNLERITSSLEVEQRRRARRTEG